ncbi:MAG: hypothetical protein A2Z97_04160 [Bdellovibrionales bacterium GWB1_52_6]|nr:MAG: hypothetical protein A2Z97_04160 [Bdellovibrionales bacterium GWB1_52_6]OFZ02429.1 MAG: hypothetical protein A2X97_12835 [Bdellovibrionales bacterium GWA1_52_35]HCM41542.1 hypothetical protein [Bdellovibrionales bacterium]
MTAFQLTQTMDVGSANPIVARLVPGLFDIIQMARIPNERKELIKSECHNIMKSLVSAEKAAKPLMDEIRAAEQRLCTEGVKTQNQGRVIETPGIMSLDNAKSFLMFSKQALQQLAAAMGVILEKDFKGPHFHKIRDQAKLKFGLDHIVFRLLEEDQVWIKEIIDLRNEDEHPKTGKAFVRGYNISPLPQGKFLVDPPKFFNDAPVLNRLEIFSHNLLTFSEEMIAHSLEFFFPGVVCVYDIPEDQRNPEMPFRYRLGLKPGVPQPGSTT